MFFWLQSGKVDCWEFNHGFQKSDLEVLYPEKNSQGASFQSSRGSCKINAPSWPTHIHECTFPLSHTTYLCIIYRSLYRAISHLKGKRGFFIMSLREGLAIFMCALKTSKIGWWHRGRRNGGDSELEGDSKHWIALFIGVAKATSCHPINLYFFKGPPTGSPCALPN